MPIVEQAKEHTKLYLCDGHRCSTKYPEFCYKNGGECIHTPDPEHSIKKKNSVILFQKPFGLIYIMPI